ncbi:MTAP family purine nucleoside phosphorylase [Selenomonas sp. TAMA-11512]|uniref:MTAP family purine nucleoside phosphorylase n=1 Tax=Selenomonas sp. TAMA-11512 TaxID=3095337 RepID=UPI00308778FF|nr:MTAP family purine nucleoside phosphorylase [Selenomonas sp. TAMA-11512]
MYIPKADFAVIGGSGTLSSDFPAHFYGDDVALIDDGLVFDTPYGKSPAMRHFKVGAAHVLTCRMHGWRSGVTRADASRQIFHIFREAGVRRILAEGGVGTINPLLDPRDIVIPDDYLDQSCRKDVMLDGRYLLVMRDALCPEMRKALLENARKHARDGFDARIFDRGTYAVTDGRHFESPAEIRMLQGHSDIVGQSLAPEVYLAREIGACYATLNYVVNYGEGIRPWSHETMSDIFYNDADIIGRILLDTVRTLAGADKACACESLRKETLLKDVYSESSDKG